MKKVQLLLLFFSVACSVLSQTILPDVIISSGEVIDSEDGSISWTIGENLIESLGTDNLLLMLGYQEIEDFPVAVEEIELDGYQIYVFPTLTESIVNGVFSEEYNLLSQDYLIDLSGHVCGIYNFSTNANEIGPGSFAPGFYLLSIINENHKPVKEIKIVKH